MKRKSRAYRIRRRILLFACAALLLGGFFIGTASMAQAGEEEQEALCKYYTSVYIESGDTLWDIAEEYCAEGESLQDYIAEVKELNGLKSDQIHAGNYLTIYYYSAEAK